ncbi:MAG TPA: hypothetical protein VIE89_04200 [Candidatus Binatia bacterium]|jgi:hypothetical protein
MNRLAPLLHCPPERIGRKTSTRFVGLRSRQAAKTTASLIRSQYNRIEALCRKPPA